MTSKSIPLSAFAVSTRFAINPERIGVLESLRPGCIEVHLVNYYKDDERCTMPGGTGLVIAGHFERLTDGVARGHYALVAGFDEVFVVDMNYESTVVLRPLGVGLGVRWELFRANQSRTIRKRHVQKKINARASKYLADVRFRVEALTGGLPGRFVNASSGPFYLTERTQTASQGAREFSMDTAVVALTVEEAKQHARARVNKLALQGWKVGQRTGVHDMMERATERTVAFFCKRGGASKWVSVECGQAQPGDPDEMKWVGRGGPGQFTVDEIVEARTTWANFLGFSGEQCGRCLAQANVLAGGPQWFCGCGHLNAQSWSDHRIAHEHPDYGPTREVLGKSYAKYRALTCKEY